MSLRQVNARLIVQSKIMAMQAGLAGDPQTGITTRRLEAHYLAGGNVPRIHAAVKTALGNVPTVAQAGQVRFRNDAVVYDDGQPDAFDPSARQHLIDELPAELRLGFLARGDRGVRRPAHRRHERPEATRPRRAELHRCELRQHSPGFHHRERQGTLLVRHLG